MDICEICKQQFAAQGYFECEDCQQDNVLECTGETIREYEDRISRGKKK